MIPVVYVLVCLIFFAAFLRLDLISRAIGLMREFQCAFGTVTDGDLSDLEKEIAIRRAVILTAGLTMHLVLRLGAVVALAAAPVLLASVAFGLDLGAFTAFSLQPAVLVATIGGLVLCGKVRRATAG